MRKVHISARQAIAAVLIGAIAAGGCADGGASSAGRSPAFEKSGIGASPRTYRLGIGDKVKIVVFGEPDLSGSYDINASGHVSLPLAGEIAAKGLDTGALKAAIIRRLTDGYLKDPKVSVDVLTYRPIFVHGEVKSGGEFAFKNGLRLRDAIAVAGGYTYRANHNYVLLTREDDAREVRVDLPNDLLVMPGDNIRVPERFF